jgi:hypothetical protein
MYFQGTETYRHHVKTYGPVVTRPASLPGGALPLALNIV